MNPPSPGWPGDVELDLLLRHAKTSTLNVLDTALDMEAGLAAIRAQHERGTAPRPPPARAGPEPHHETAHHAERDRHTEPDHHDNPCHETEGLFP